MELFRRLYLNSASVQVLVQVQHTKLEMAQNSRWLKTPKLLIHKTNTKGPKKRPHKKDPKKDPTHSPTLAAQWLYAPHQQSRVYTNA